MTATHMKELIDTRGWEESVRLSNRPQRQCTGTCGPRSVVGLGDNPGRETCTFMVIACIDNAPSGALTSRILWLKDGMISLAMYSGKIVLLEGSP
jgi:hypothetical protein